MFFFFEWQTEIQWAEKYCNGKTATANIYRMTQAGAVYYLWQERNNRVFQRKQRSSDYTGGYIQR